ncbi:GA-binding protein subunit beta-1-like [Ptychodera flava]|uniref:GA-binding protein subunit beta-1-like n=1 Tax=Ptychodera flava TaxID=63121 RepID=UPI00396A3E7A
MAASQDLIDAAWQGDLQRVKSLIDARCDVNGRGDYYWNKSTALHAASGQGHADVAELLIKHRADVNARNRDKSTALHEASGDGHADVAELLIKHGVDVNAKDQVSKCDSVLDMDIGIVRLQQFRLSLSHFNIAVTNQIML